MTPLKIGQLASTEYRQQLQDMYRKGMWSSGGEKYAAEALQLARKVGARSVLDYGCGAVDLDVAIRAVDPKTNLVIDGYDPGVPGREALPTPHDVVVCTDVLEHIEPDFVPAVLAHIHQLTNQAALLVIATRPASKRLPDGRNAHLTIDSADWWFQQIAAQGSWTPSVRSLDEGSVKLWLRQPIK